jgi:hypothetical protein
MGKNNWKNTANKRTWEENSVNINYNWQFLHVSWQNEPSLEMSQSANTIYFHNPTDWVYMLQCYLPGKLLVVLASTIILGSESRGTHDHILLSHDSESHATSPVQSSRLLLAFASIVVLGFEPRLDPWPYFHTSQILMCFETGPPLVEEESPFQNRLVVLERKIYDHVSRWGPKPMMTVLAKASSNLLFYFIR